MVQKPRILISSAATRTSASIMAMVLKMRERKVPQNTFMAKTLKRLKRVVLGIMAARLGKEQWPGEREPGEQGLS
jgi:hypothetical protein